MQKLNEIPQSRYAEAAVIGSCLFDKSVVPLILENCVPSDFFNSDLQILFEGIAKIWREQDVCDALVLRQHLEDTGKWTKETFDLLVKIGDTTPSAANAEYYAKIVKSKKQERDLIEKADKLGKAIYEKALSLSEKKALFEQLALSIPLDEKNREEILHAISQRYLKNLLSEDYGGTIIYTGYNELDEYIGGLESGQLMVIAARPSKGKTTMALEMALTISRRNPVLFLSLEMNKESICERAISNIARLKTEQIKKLPQENKDLIEHAIEKLKDYQIFIDDNPALSPAAITSKILKAKAAYNISCVFIDYLQLISIPGYKGDNRATEMAKISSAIKEVAKRARIPIVVLSQLNRMVEHRESPEPRLSDIRESGAIEQDADIVLFLYEEKTEAVKGYESYERFLPEYTLFCKIAKNRQGVRDKKIQLNWTKEFYTMKDVIQDKEIPI